MWMFRGSSTEVNYISLLSFIFSVISFPSETFCSLRRSLNFSNIKKLKNILTWETICNRCTFIKFIIRFQMSKRLVYNVWTNCLSTYMTPAFKIPFQLIQSIHWKLMALVKYCIYLLLLWECWKCLPLFENFTLSMHYCYFLNQDSLGN